MIKHLHLKNVALAPDLRVDWADRINLIVGDNGVGKSFLLDTAWWALTRTWAGNPAVPDLSKKHPTIQYSIKGLTKPANRSSEFRREDQGWPIEQAKPPMPGIVVYVRIDGGFSVWDPARNYSWKDPDRPEAYHFQSKDVWDGLDVRSKSDGRSLRVCEGLERDWVSWQEGKKQQFESLSAVLEVLSAHGEKLIAAPPDRIFLGEGRARPRLRIGAEIVPVAFASAGVRRILALAYLLVWAWEEHRQAAKLLGKDPEERLVILFDEPETHLHPKWQRTIVPSLLKAADQLRSVNENPPQLLVATHSPLVAASIEPYFEEESDDLIHLSLEDGKVQVRQGGWSKQGDATNWLVSEPFGLEQARSLEAEIAIEEAEAFMRGERKGISRKDEIHKRLQQLLAPGDEFWPRWIVSNNPKYQSKGAN